MTDNTNHAIELDDELLSIDEVAALLRAPVATLRYWRRLGIRLSPTKRCQSRLDLMQVS